MMCVYYGNEKPIKEEKLLKIKDPQCQFCKFGDRKRAVVAGKGVCQLLERTDKPSEITDWTTCLADCPIKEQGK